MMWPGPGSVHSSRARFQCTTCQPPVPSPSSTAVVFTTTSSPSVDRPGELGQHVRALGPVAEVDLDALQPGALLEQPHDLAGPERRHARSGYRTGDQALDAVVARLERVLAEHGALRLVVELQVHPVDGVVALAFLGPLDERAAQPGPRGLRRRVHRVVDVLVGGDALDLAAPLEQVVERPGAGDVVVREVEQRDARVREREVVPLAVRLDQVVLDHPVDLGRAA